MRESEPVVRTTKQLIADIEDRQEAFAKVGALMATARGTAHDSDDTVQVTVDARGKLLDLWLSPDAVKWGGSRLGELIVEVAEVAMSEATQDGYNKVALLLGEDLTYAIEQLSGVPAPARAEDDDPGMTVEEFQRQRAQRLRATTDLPSSEPSLSNADDDDWQSFDPASLRSDR